MSILEPNGVLNLSIPEQPIAIGGRTFILREMTGDDFERYFGYLLKASEQSTRGVQSVVNPAENANLKNLTKAQSEAEKAEVEILKWLLVDTDGVHADAAFIKAHMTFTVREKVFQVQNELNRLEERVGNFLSLANQSAQSDGTRPVTSLRSATA